ncbi:PREDICTED: uncharacterized protein LOC105958248 isoform X1 [Erythranthe guttata]|uniref:uncharacterized protein LOC105958248 isoform X1 n=1 Tax=Erythranthe guttata TaxID=4155 RepID=UPI00064DBF0A|nr:PREDICTED: uncharacterized protein LOC105958248 isoform X1 [Erythranthe guttata]|eukprot:XP_012837707.1 PREDICTED: uncharacterized protein LOC105958248 isoform X1 [Erythranthe guttata]
MPITILMRFGALISVLQKKAERFELKKLQVLKLTKDGISSLEPLFQDVYASCRPKPLDYQVRRDLIRVFNDIAKEIYGNSKENPVVVEFGSFVMDLFSISSDLDLSVNFSTTAVDFPREKKIQTLRKFAKKLYAMQSKGHVTGVLPITTAKVPILKCIDRGTGVECDISVENRDGILKSQIIYIISSIDDRFHKLSFLMKTWAKAHNINSSKDKTLNSLSIILLVAFHLQTRNPPILPTFSAIFKDGTDPATVVKSLCNFVNYGKPNRESLAELFASLLIKLSSVEKLWAKGICASAYKGCWTSKTWDSKVANISVEDFTDQSQNVARAVGQAEVKKIYKCIDISIKYIMGFIDGQIGVEVKELLFGQGQDGIIPTGSSKLHRIAGLPYEANQATRKVNGKRRREAEFSLIKKISVEKAAASAKKPKESWGEAAHVRNQHVFSGGWEGTQRPATGGWGATAAVGSSWEATQRPAAGGWGSTPHQAAAGGWGSSLHQPASRGWGSTPHQPAAGGWGSSPHPASKGWGSTPHQPAAGGWGSSPHPASKGWRASQQPAAGGWGGSHRPGGWGESQRPAAGGWGESQRPAAGGWGESKRPAAGGWGESQRPAAGGWGESQQPAGGGWGGIQPPAGGGWGGSQRPADGGWGGMQPPAAKGWGGSQRPAAGGGWGGIQQQPAAGGGWGGTPNNNTSVW